MMANEYETRPSVAFPQAIGIVCVYGDDDVACEDGSGNVAIMHGPSLYVALHNRYGKKVADAETAKQARWNAVYGATIGALTASAIKDAFDASEGDTEMPREAIKEFVRVAREIADAALAVDP